MKLDLTSVKKNPLLKRQEVEFKVEEPSTPSRSKIKLELAVALRVDMNQVYVKEIETLSGTHTTIGSAHVYDDADHALTIEPKYMIERNKSAASESEAEKPEDA